MSFALMVRFTVREGCEDAFDDLIADTVTKIRSKEPSTLVYTCHQVHGEPRQRIFYELYRDREAFDAHQEQDHTRHFLSAREPLLENTEVDFMSLVDGKVLAAEGRATADG